MRLPSYRCHKASGQAVVTLRGVDHYLGVHGSEESRVKYQDLISEYQRTETVRKKKASAKAKSKSSDGPSYRLHSRSGQAIVVIAGRTYYLGKFNSPESKTKYHRLRAEYIASGLSDTFGVPANEITIVEVILAWVKWAKEYYGDGPESELHRAVPVLRVLRKLYGDICAVEFGPLQYEAVRVVLMEPIKVKKKTKPKEILKAKSKLEPEKPRYRSRTYINSQMKRVRGVFKWASSKSLIPVSVLETIKTVEPLKFGRTAAPEAPPVEPVSDEVVEATLKHLPQVVADMVRFQLLVGCRPGEVCSITPSMIDRTTDVWEINLAKHKTAWRGKKRTIYVGPKAQDVLRPYLLRASDAYCFSPIEADKQRREARHAARKTPLSCGNKPGDNVVKKPRKAPGECYDTGTYARAINYACQRAKIKPWGPNRLRHSLATSVRKSDGLEAAAVILGHSEVGVTQIYAEADRAKAIEVVRRIG